MRTAPVTLFLCGDVMLGRGVDQILPHPGDPTLRERYIQDAVTYVDLAEAANGRIPRPVGFSWPWGDALRVLEEAAPEVRVVNLETSVTQSDDFAAGKAVNYRMSPANLPCLAVARPDACVLANNHVMDFGRRGLEETLDVLAGAGLRSVGAGRVRRAKRPGDVAVVSIHWGSNWGYWIPREQRARRMRLQHASQEDSEWLRTVLDRAGRNFGSRVDLEPDGTLALQWT